MSNVRGHMQPLQFAAWQAELLETGAIVQDSDASVSQIEAERRFNRYLELVDGIDGTEGPHVALALVKSIQAEHDFSAYEATIGALFHVCPWEQSVAAVICELPRLIDDLPDRAGDLLSLMARDTQKANRASAFNVVLSSMNNDKQRKIIAFIREQERSGWLEDVRGTLAPGVL